MNHLLWMLLLFVGTVLVTGPLRAEQLLYLASTQDKSVVAYDVDDSTGSLSPKFRVELPGNPGPMAFSPDKSFIYVAMTGWNGKSGDEGAAVASLRRSADGTLTLAGTASLPTRAPYIRTDREGELLLAAHYGDGSVTVQRITKGICTDEVLDHQKTERTAHCIELDPSGQFVFVPHTAPNKVYQFRLDAAQGKLLPNDPPFVAGPEEGHQYHAPRHYAHHPQLELAYTSNEAGGGITCWQFDAKQGTLQRRQTLSTLPPDYEGTSAAADIHLTADGRFAYVSNRDTTRDRKPDQHRDTLATIALDPETGHMKIVGHVATVHFPRSFCIDATGKYLFAAGQQSDTMQAYRINQESGELESLETYQTGGAPIWVMCGTVQ